MTAHWSGSYAPWIWGYRCKGHGSEVRGLALVAFLENRIHVCSTLIEWRRVDVWQGRWELGGDSFEKTCCCSGSFVWINVVQQFLHPRGGYVDVGHWAISTVSFIWEGLRIILSEQWPELLIQDIRFGQWVVLNESVLVRYRTTPVFSLWRKTKTF